MKNKMLFYTGAAMSALLFFTVIVRANGAEGSMAAGTLPAGTESLLQVYAAAGASVVDLVENTDGTDNGVRKLLAGLTGVKFYRQGNNNGLVGTEDVVLIKINSQWAERGGTNTDLLKSVIEVIINHPSGFNGEIVIADNGQGMFGSENRGGRLDWASPNSKDRKQSAQAVADYFAAAGYKVSGVLWDTFTKKKVGEFSNGDTNDGYVVEPEVKPTGIKISYPKFTTKYGTHISFKQGIWDTASKTYDSKRLRLINMPVLKSHQQYHVTGAVKSFMGVPSNALSDMSPHKSVGSGGMGTLMVNTRFPVLNILDMIYIAPQRGPPSPYNTAVQKNMIAASVDPFALDFWAAKNVLVPAAETAGYTRAKSMSPENTEPGSFGYWLNRSLNEARNAQLPVMTDGSTIVLNRIP